MKGSITVPVTVDLSPLAEQLRAAADLLDPRPPSATAEDLRGADAEIGRLQAENALLRDVADAAGNLNPGSPHDPGWRTLTDALGALYEARQR